MINVFKYLGVEVKVFVQYLLTYKFFSGDTKAHLLTGYTGPRLYVSRERLKNYMKNIRNEVGSLRQKSAIVFSTP